MESAAKRGYLLSREQEQARAGAVREATAVVQEVDRRLYGVRQRSACSAAARRMKECVFCDLASLRCADVYFENEHCAYASTRDPRDPPDVLPGSGILVPIAHRASPFDFTP